MNRKYTLFLLLMLFGAVSFAQSYKGIVYFSTAEGGKEPAAYANVSWIEGKTSVETDENGKFTLKNISGENATLIASFIGYKKDSIKVVENGVNLFPDNNLEFILISENELESLVVTGRREANYLSKTTQIKTEVISAAGLCKMACCSLAESFENSASVSVGYSDAVTGAKQIKLLGLSGSYTQMLDENRPVMRGLAAPFGLSYIPGQWLESIQIAKGPSSVINGLEAITGQINMEHRKPTAENPLFVNLFLNSNLRTEANIASSLQLNDKWSTVIQGHTSFDNKKVDENNDGFRDDPMTRQFNFDNRWLYIASSGVQLRFGAKYLNDRRIGGQMDYKDGMNKRVASSSVIGSNAWGEAFEKGIWGSEIHNESAVAYFKLGIPLNEDNSKNIAFVGDYSYYKMNSSFGKKDFNGKQNMGFFNAMFQNEINENHRMTLGVSARYDDINQILYQPNSENYSVSDDLGIVDKVVGAYGEYTFTKDDDLTFVAGVRADYSTKFGWMFVPRANLKYSFTKNTIVRINAGRGLRNPNVIADNLGILSSGRYIKFDEDIDIEDAWTFGGNFTQYFKLGHSENSYISFDYFRTSFNNQMVVDWDKGAAASTVNVYNCPGRSFTDTYQVDLSVEPFERFTAIATFRYNNAKITMQDKGLVDTYLTSRYKGVLNLQYATRMNKWTFDFTAQVNGPCNLPDFMGGGKSEVYPMLFAQVTRKFKGVDVYVGAENITNYMQKDPIINAQSPYSKDFNASMIWGPLMGRMFYAGMRLTLWK